MCKTCNYRHILQGASVLYQAEENHSACSCYLLCRQSRGPGHLDYLAVFVSVDHSEYSHSENAVRPRLRYMF